MERAVGRLCGMAAAGVGLRDVAISVVRRVRGLREVDAHNFRVEAKWAILWASRQWREVVMHDLGGERGMRRWERRKAQREAQGAAVMRAVGEAVRDGCADVVEVALRVRVGEHDGLRRAVEGCWPAMPGRVVQDVRDPERVRVRFGRRRSLCGRYALARVASGRDVLAMVRAEVAEAGVELVGLAEPGWRRRARREALVRLAEVRGRMACADVVERRAELARMRAEDEAARRAWCVRHGVRDAWTERAVEVTPEELRCGAELYVDVGRVVRRLRGRTRGVRRVLRWRRGAGPRWFPGEVAARGRWPPMQRATCSRLVYGSRCSRPHSRRRIADAPLAQTFETVAALLPQDEGLFDLRDCAPLFLRSGGAASRRTRRYRDGGDQPLTILSRETQWSE